MPELVVPGAPAPAPAVGASPAAAPPPAYRLRRARSEADLRAAQLLRFMVFNLELHEGLEASY
jgi:putative hemolysin